MLTIHWRRKNKLPAFSIETYAQSQKGISQHTTFLELNKLRKFKTTKNHISRGLIIETAEIFRKIKLAAVNFVNLRVFNTLNPSKRLLFS